MKENYTGTNVQNISDLSNQQSLNALLFNTSKIDSFSLLIPFEEDNKDALIVSSTFNEPYQKVYYTGETEEDFNFYNNYQKIDDFNTSTFIKYKVVRRLWNGENKSFVQVMLTSKLLLNNYFTGINKNNIDLILDRINNDNIVYLDKNTLLNSFVTDIDLCKDYEVNKDQFIELKQQLISLVIDSKQSVINSKRINSNDMFGIQYNERHKATPAKPFAKLYFKTAELINKSKDFYIKNLQHHSKQINKGIARFEVTIKASQHKKKLGIEKVKTLNDLLNLDHKELNRIYNSIVNEYYTASNKIKNTNTEKMSTSNLIISKLIDKILQLDNSITTAELIHIVCVDISDRKQKHLAKNKILEVIQLSNNSKQIALNDEKKKVVIDVLKDLNILED